MTADSSPAERASAPGPAPRTPLGRLWRWAASAPRAGHRGRIPVVVAALALGLYALATPVVMLLDYRFPDPYLAPPRVEGEEPVAGVAYVDALLHVHRRGMRPWLVNDRVYPTVFLDNPQSFQRGELEGLRRGVRVLRDNLSRLRSTDAIDADVEEAFNHLAAGAEWWILPPAEKEYAAAARALGRYRERLLRAEAHFYPRADNLVELIREYNSLTGGANTRLLNCVGDLQLRRSEELADDPNLEAESVVRTDVPWSEVDDHFYYARGVAFVYREVMAAVVRDFREVLAARHAGELARSIGDDFLAYAQFEPLYVANGGYGSMWANHPYQLLGLLSQVRERSRSLNTMLSVNVP